ncbi:hypothetical protein REMIM1_PE00220 (plasmid) [Rhizobium etli bv. mimosae str. Mim1]|nr:hypothetical protein REMIM1_PE00220 [Rhizobium etli bv. mimosae str. Mim1]
MVFGIPYRPLSRIPFAILCENLARLLSLTCCAGGRSRRLIAVKEAALARPRRVKRERLRNLMPTATEGDRLRKIQAT